MDQFYPAAEARGRSSKHAAHRSRRPRLHPEDLDHDSKLLGLVDQLLLADDKYAQLTAKLLAAQDRLQELSEPDGWTAFLDVEQLTTERVTLMLAVSARWAFDQGRRSLRDGGE